MFAREQQRFTILEMAADWHELMGWGTQKWLSAYLTSLKGGKITLRSLLRTNRKNLGCQNAMFAVQQVTSYFTKHVQFCC